MVSNFLIRHMLHRALVLESLHIGEFFLWGGDRKCTILYLFHTPNDLFGKKSPKVGDYLLYLVVIKFKNNLNVRCHHPRNFVHDNNVMV